MDYYFWNLLIAIILSDWFVGIKYQIKLMATNLYIIISRNYGSILSAVCIQPKAISVYCRIVSL